MHARARFDPASEPGVQSGALVTGRIQIAMGKEATEKAKTRDRARERELVTALFDKIGEDGKPYSRARIIRETGVSARQVTKIAAEAGYKFDRSSPGLQAMKAANEVDARAARDRISQQVLDELQGIFEKMHEPHVVIGWHQGRAFEHKLKGPTSSDLKNYATTIGILIDKHLALDRYRTEGAEVDPTLGRVQTATEVARIMKAHPDMPVEEVINEVINR